MQEVFEKIKERLEEEVISLEDNYGDLVECIPSKIVFEIVNQVEDEYKYNGWIPVSSGNLPRRGECVSATVLVESQKRRFVSQILYDDIWLEGDAKMIAWQPLPEPYKESED